MIFMHGTPKPFTSGNLTLKPREIYSVKGSMLVTANGAVSLDTKEVGELRKTAIVLPKSQLAKAPAAVRDAEENNSKPKSSVLKESTPVRKFEGESRPYKKHSKSKAGKGIKLRPVAEPYLRGRHLIKPPSDKLLQDIEKVSKFMGNNFTTTKSFRLGSGAYSYFVNEKEGPLIVLAESDIKMAMSMTGSSRLSAIGAILNHEFAHWAYESIIAKLDKKKFKEECGSKPMFDMSQHSRNYAWYLEQFAVLVEYGRWGTSLRPLKALNGVEIVAKYFDLPYLEKYL